MRPPAEHPGVNLRLVSAGYRWMEVANIRQVRSVHGRNLMNIRVHLCRSQIRIGIG